MWRISTWNIIELETLGVKMYTLYFKLCVFIWFMSVDDTFSSLVDEVNVNIAGSNGVSSGFVTE